MAAAESSTAAAHVLVFPFPAQGHMLPLLDLADHLSGRGLAITVVVTDANLPLLRPLLSRRPAVRPLSLPFPHHPSLPAGVENLRSLPPSLFIAVMHALPALRDPIIRWARSAPSPPDAILSDFFLGWTNSLAADLAIPRLVFSPSSALTLALSHNLWRKMPDSTDPEALLSFPDLPTAPTYPIYQLSSLYRAHRKGDPVWEFIRDGFLANTASWGFVFNTFDKLEGPWLDYLRRDLGHRRVWAVGPIGVTVPAAEERGGTSSVSAEEVAAWLDGCPAGSVVYVCFGSQLSLTAAQAAAVAAGLERSGARFVWAAKEAETEAAAAAAAEGLERGMVIKGWAPQAAILGHVAVGAFVTHCGWNSVLEGMAAGVELLTWPMRADQYLNARLVEEAGVGVRVWEGPDEAPDPDVLARVVAEWVSGTRPPERAAAVARMKKWAAEGVKEGGSSYVELSQLVEDLSKLAK